MANELFKTVAVVGSGTMGLGIAQVCAMSGVDTVLYDIRKELVEGAIETIKKNLKAAAEKKKISVEEATTALLHLKPAFELTEIKADLVMEAVVEKLDVKQKLFLALEENNKDSTIFASNTSSLSITAIGSVLKNPAHFLGLHFFNPAPVMKLVEIISGEKTHSGLPDQISLFVRQLNKIPVRAKDSPGFIVNRVARHYYLESLRLLEQGNGNVDAIDRLLRSSGFKMGPFELMDLIGIDVNLAVSKSVYEGFDQNPRFQPNRIQEEKVKGNQLGRKTGKGFYEYPKN